MVLAPSPSKLPSDSLPPPPAPQEAFCESLKSMFCLQGQGGPLGPRLRQTGPLTMMSWVGQGQVEGCQALSRAQGACKWDQGRNPQTQEASRVGRGCRRRILALELSQCRSALPAPPGGSEEDPDLQRAVWLSAPHPAILLSWVAAWLPLRRDLSPCTSVPITFSVTVPGWL